MTFKTSNYALTVALLTHAGLASAVCDGEISRFSGVECNAANFQANLSGDCVIDELFPDVAAGTRTLDQEVADLCAYDAPLQFVEIQGTYQKDRRYFAGGGPLVDGGDWSVDAGNVIRFEANGGQNTVISWPDYLARVAYNNDQGYGNNGYPANMNLEVSCGLQAAMCCFATGDFEANSDDTTDVCRHDLENSPYSSHINRGWSVFPGPEAATHCVGFAWNDGQDELIGNMLYDASLRNSINKGYLKGVPGAPMCGCVEHMPIVESAACRTATRVGDISYVFTVEDGVVRADNEADITYGDCPNDNDLAAQYKANGGGDEIDAHLVGSGGCEADLATYMNDEQFQKAAVHETRYKLPDFAEWSDLFIGEGIHFLPPAKDSAEADAEFRSLIEAGCWDDDGQGGRTPRYCMVRRMCSSCSSIPHRDIFYKRLSPLPDASVDFLQYFTDYWKSAENSMGADNDFQLFSAYDDALAGENAWEYCNYDSSVGFPRDCGPRGYVGDQWNSYTVHGHGSANHHGYYVELPKP